MAPLESHERSIGDVTSLVKKARRLLDIGDADPIKKAGQKKPLNIGFVSIWFERGQSYVTKTLRDALCDIGNTFIFARTGEVFGNKVMDLSGCWDVPNLTTYHEYEIPPSVLLEWIKANKIDVLVFNEEYNWELVKKVKSSGVKIITYLDYYKDEWKPLLSLYDLVLCSTHRTYDLVKSFCKAHYIGWAVDGNLYIPTDTNETFTFFHNAGWLGTNYRKMTPAAVLAFDAISKHFKDITLLIHSQASLDKLPALIGRIVKKNPRITFHEETIPAPGLYHKGKIFLFPTKLEGLGLPLPEAMACGLPAIVTNAPPMNEFVENGYNGFLVEVAHIIKREDNIAFPETLININDLSAKMAMCVNHPDLVKTMGKNARKYVVDNLSVTGFEKRVQDSIRSLFKGNKCSNTITSGGKCEQALATRVVITSHFSKDAETVIRTLLESRSDIIGIIFQRPQLDEDAIFKRRRECLLSDLKQRNINLLWHDTVNINSIESQDLLSKWRPDRLITIGGRILKEEVIEIPKNGVVNLHSSVLPKYRNLGSEFWALYYNDLQHIGHTIHFVDTGVDTGPILMQQSIEVDPSMTENDLKRTNLKQGATSLAKALELLDTNSIVAKEQSNQAALYFPAPNPIDRERASFRQSFRQNNYVQNSLDKKKQILVIGISEITYAWKQVFEQEGLPFEVVQFNERLDHKDYSLIVINRELNHQEIPHITQYIESGGAVVSDLRKASLIDDDIRFEEAFIDVLRAEPINAGDFDEMITLQMSGFISDQAKWGQLNDNRPAIIIKKIGKGFIVGFPFEPELALMDTRISINSSIAINTKRSEETTSLVNKGGIRRLITACFKWLHRKRSLPYVHLWYYPGTYQSAFAFRIDSDGYEAESFENTYIPAHQHGIAMSWFLDVGAQIDNLEHAVKIRNTGQDIHCHGFVHQTFDDYERNYKNMAVAITKMQQVGLNPLSFVAPYGMWNSQLNRAMEKIGIQYSSEFSISWDDLPFYPLVNKKRLSKVLQIPIHPFCLGTMLKADYEIQEVQSYFDKIIEWKYQINEPILLYGHPIDRLGAYPQVLDHIFRTIKSKDLIWLTNFTEFAKWWRHRQQDLVLPTFDGEQLDVHVYTPRDKTFVRIIDPSGKSHVRGFKGGWQYRIDNQN